MKANQTFSLKYLFVLVLCFSLISTSVLPAQAKEAGGTDTLVNVEGTQGAAEFDCSTVTDVWPSECEALKNFYLATNGDAWKVKTNWFSLLTVGDWYGVDVSSNYVSTIYFSENLLSGTIADALNAIKAMPSLNRLELPYNNLTGPLPTFTNGDFPSLTNLNLRGNKISSLTDFPVGCMPNLGNMNLSENLLTGTLPGTIGNLSNLAYLYLRYNQLSGAIPESLGNLSKLSQLYLNNNKLDGQIPSTLGGVATLKYLYLNANKLSGGFPSSFPINGRTLNGLDIGYNLLNVPAVEPVASWLAIYDSDWDQTQGVVETLADTGGTLITIDGNTEITVQPGSFEGEITLTYLPQAAPNHDPGSSLLFGNIAFELTAQDGETPVTTFSEPIIIEIKYGTNLYLDENERDLVLYYWDTSTEAWADVASTCSPDSSYQRDLDLNYLAVPVCHLSEFALMLDYVIVGGVAPVFSSSPVNTAQSGVIYTYEVSASDADAGDTLIFSAKTLPDWLSLTDNGGGSATLSGTPTSGEIGGHDVELRVFDSFGLADTQIFTVIVEEVGGSSIFLPVIIR